jgi:hypothetical protein
VSGRGRPLKFLALVGGGWTGLRVLMLWPDGDPLPGLVREVAPLVAAPARAETAPAIRLPAPMASTRPSARPPAARPVLPAPADPSPYYAPPAAPLAQATGRSLPSASVAPLAPVLPPAELPPASPPATAALPALPSRLSGSAWLLVRGPGTATGLVGASQLGGGQGGVRLAYALGEGRRVAVTLRGSAPLALSRDREVALGLAWRPTALPVQLVAERRLVPGRGRGGTAVGLVGGFGLMPAIGGVTLEAYGQAGAIVRGRADAFGDGALRLAHPVAELGGVGLDVGLGAWGGAQRGAARLDLGPSIAASLPLADRRVRIALDWRQRIAGAARPGSGPALSVGTDF